MDGGTDTGTGDGGVDAGPGPAALTIDPNLQDFGTIPIGSESSEVIFTVTNDGESASGALTATIVDPTSFDLTMDGCTGEVLAPDATCSIGVTFAPAEPGAAMTRLSVTDGTASASATLEGEGAVGDGLVITPTPHNFGTVELGSTSTDQAFTVRNIGTIASGPITSGISGVDVTHFEVVSDACDGMTLDADASCDIVVRYSPSATGAHAGTVQASADPGGMVEATVSGTAIQPPNLRIVPSVQDFGSVVVGSSSSAVDFTVTNIGGGTTGAISRAFGGTDASEFSVVSGTCDGATLAGGDSCTISVRFNAASAGTKSATLDVTATPGGAVSASLAASALGTPGLTITPTPQDFGSSPVGTPSAAQTFTVTNTGGSATGALAVAIAGSHPADFPIVAGTDACNGVVLPAGGTCTIAARFTPSTAGPRNASLSVSATPGGTASAALSGVGLAPAEFRLTPASADFGAVAVGATSSDVVFTLTNIGGATSGTPTITLRGTLAGQFMIAGDGCTAPLAGGASCTITLRFMPTATGTRTAELEAAGTPGGTQTSSLVGEGITPTALGLEPTSRAFGSIVEGLTSASTMFTVTNGGMEASGALATSLTGTDAGDFEITMNNCAGVALAGGASCTIFVRFAPDSVGTKAANLVVTGSPGGTRTSALSGTGTDDIDICWGDPLVCTPNAFAWTVQVGNTATETFTVRNNGAARTFSATTIGGTHAAQFSIVSGGDGCNGAALGIGGTCDVTVRFSPTGAIGPRSATLTASASGGATTTLTINGTASGPIVVTPNPHPFGDVRVGDSETQSFTVTNTGSATSPTLATQLSVASGQFAITRDTCAGNALPGTGGANTCEIDILYYPQATGAGSGTVTVQYGVNTASATFTGNALPGATLTITPASQDFGTVRATATADRTFTLGNSGGFETGDLSSIMGLAAPFSVTGGTCPTADDRLDPGETCTIIARFAPLKTNTPGDYDDTLSVSASPGGSVSGDVSATMISALTISPATNAFAARETGTTSAATSFTVTNNAAVGTGPIQVTLAGTNSSDFAITANTCTSLAAGASCTVSVTFTPGADGARGPASLRASEGAFGTNPGSTAIATLTGTGLAPAVLSIDPTSKAFGAVLLGTNSESFTFTVTNDGGVATGTLTAMLSSAQYNITSNTCTGTLAAGATCTVAVRLSPTGSAGSRSTTLTVGVSGGVSTSATLTGSAVSSGLSVTPTPVDFGSVIAGSDSAFQTFTVTNNHTTSATGTLTVTPDAGFTLGTSSCGASLPVGGSCTFQARFSPASGSSGFLQGSIVVGATSVGDGTAAVSGTAIPPVDLELSPTSHAYGSRATGTSTARTFTLTNNGGVASATLSLSLGGADPGQFSVAAGTCTGTLGAGASCTFTVSFAPTTAGSKSASVTVMAGTLSETSTLTGTGVLQATLGITPTAAAACGSATAFTSIFCRTYMVTNGGDVPSGDLAISMTDGTNFSRTGGSVDCNSGSPLAAGASCDISVSFTPQTVGAHSNTLTVSASPGGSVNVTQSGTGTSGLTATGSGAFSSIAVGSASAATTFTFTNASGSGATGVLVAVISGTAGADYDVVSDECTGAPLADGGSCDVEVRFVPSATGTRNASLRVDDGTAEKRATVSLTGTGT